MQRSPSPSHRPIDNGANRCTHRSSNAANSPLAPRHTTTGSFRTVTPTGLPDAASCAQAATYHALRTYVTTPSPSLGHGREPSPRRLLHPAAVGDRLQVVVDVLDGQGRIPISLRL